MKSIFLFIILVYGVFDALTDEVKFVMEGDSVTLHTNLTELQTDYKIDWFFGPEDSSKLLAQIDGNRPLYPNVPDIFKDRLHIDPKTGDLTIMNMRHIHSGSYRPTIDKGSEGESPKRTFTVTVNYDPRVINPAADEVNSVSVKEGESVTLHTDVPELQRHDLIVWRFGDEGILIAKDDKEDNKSPEYDDVPDKRFSGKLRMDNKTGALIISHTTTQHTGVYKVKISSKEKKHKTFNVLIVHYSEQGLSAGSIAGIVLCVLLSIAGVIVAAVIWSRRRVSTLKKLKAVTAVTVKVFQADDLTLPPDPEDIQTADEGEWIFADKEIIAEFDKKISKFLTYDNVMDERFKDKLKLNRQTGSLMIRTIKTRHSGLYKLKINSRTGSSYIHYNVIVKGRDKTVHLGGSVTLETGVTDLKKANDEILWTFGPEDTRIVRITGGTNEPSYFDDTDFDGAVSESFRDRLKMNKQTGDLTITDILDEHIGVYEVQTYVNGETRYKKFTINTVDSLKNKRRESPNDDREKESANLL